MTAAQWTFVLVGLGVTAGGAVWSYPGIAAHARSRRDSALAAVMAWSLTGLFCALAASSCVNAVVVALS